MMPGKSIKPFFFMKKETVLLTGPLFFLFVQEFSDPNQPVQPMAGVEKVVDEEEEEEEQDQEQAAVVTGRVVGERRWYTEVSVGKTKQNILIVLLQWYYCRQKHGTTASANQRTRCQLVPYKTISYDTTGVEYRITNWPIRGRCQWVPYRTISYDTTGVEYGIANWYLLLLLLLQ